MLLRGARSDRVPADTFFPSFLMLGFLNFAVGRWMDIMRQMYKIEGGICDIGLLVGVALAEPSAQPARRFAYRIYRYLVAFHIVTYYDRSHDISRLGVADSLVTLGLLTREEVPVLMPARKRMRETLLGWIGFEIEEALRDGTLRVANAASMHDALRTLRGRAGWLQDLLTDWRHPNSWGVTMNVLVNSLVLLIVCGYPIVLYEPRAALQPWTILSVAFMCVAYRSALSIVNALARPIEGRTLDTLNPQNTISCAESTIFSTLRANFDVHKRRDKRRAPPAAAAGEEVSERM